MSDYCCVTQNYCVPNSLSLSFTWPTKPKSTGSMCVIIHRQLKLLLNPTSLFLPQPIPMIAYLRSRNKVRAKRIWEKAEYWLNRILYRSLNSDLGLPFWNGHCIPWFQISELVYTVSSKGEKESDRR
jgi:hypothetical protein